MASTQTEQPTTVHVKNISPSTSEAQVRDFFSFCGKISNLSMAADGPTQSAAVTFEKPNAAKTALLLDNTQLGPSQVAVSAAASLAELSVPDPATEKSTATGAADDSVAQEDKPRSRILAEYLAHGYTVSDKAIERALALDKQHGVSTRFSAALSSFDQRSGASATARSVDAKYGVSERGQQTWNGLHSYFEKALGSPTGQKLRSFYAEGSKQVLDVHTEARRLADLKAGKPAQGAVPSVEEAGMQQVDGVGHTKCNCGGADGKCPCTPGKCTCSGCGKNTGEPLAEKA